MNGLLDSFMRRRAGVDAATSEANHWRRVPRINVLPRRAGAPGGRAGLKRALAALLVLEAVLLVVQYQSRNANESAIESTNKQLQQVRQQVAGEQQELEKLQTQVDALKKQVEASEQAFKQSTGGRTSWYTGLAALLNTRTDGVEFESITATTGGQIALTGVATDLVAMARFQEKLREVQQYLRLQNISFSNGPASLTFNATLKVAQ